MGLTVEQQAAYDTITKGTDNVFLTGDAGTGKSYVLNRVIEAFTKADENVRICAPTGVAAVNVNGVTLHRLLSLTPSNTIIGEKPKSIPKKLKGARHVIVDEISMCRSDLFSWLVNCIKLEEKRQHKHIQLIVVGDFCQLPPVITEKEEEFFKDTDGFAFATKEWQECQFKAVVLKKVVRQSNPDFTKALNSIRMGDAKGLAYINKRASRKRIPNAIIICPTNKRVKQTNDKQLEKAKRNGDIFKRFVAVADGRINDSDKPAPDEVTLWRGARILCIANGAGYSNGSTGTVEDFTTTDAGLAVVAKLDDEQGTTIIERSSWDIFDYVTKTKKDKNGRKKKKLEKVKIGSFSQLPVKLGYAITIHKSQGKTYDKVVIHPAGWASGLLYVALSRVKSVEKMVLNETLKSDMVFLDPQVKRFYKQLGKRPGDRRGGRRKGAGRKRMYAGSATATIRVPEIFINDLKEIKKMDSSQIQKFQKVMDEFVEIAKRHELKK